MAEKQTKDGTASKKIGEEGKKSKGKMLKKEMETGRKIPFNKVQMPTDQDTSVNEISSIITAGGKKRTKKSLPELKKVSARTSSMRPFKSEKTLSTEGEMMRKICIELMEEFQQEALDICDNRFLHRESSMLMALELRDTWLRIANCEWMASAIVSNETLPSAAFSNSHDPPLPPMCDFWSRGVLQVLPQSRRESVLDPFIRQRIRGKIMPQDDGSGDSIAVNSSAGADESLLDISLKNFIEEKIDKNIGIRKKPSVVLSPESGKPKPAPVGEKIKEIGTQTSHLKMKGEGDVPPSMTSIVSDRDMATISNSQDLNQKMSAQEREIEILKSVVSLVPSMEHSNKYKPWTISQCGANDGTGGVFRLLRQTTSEAIRQRPTRTTLSDPEMASTEVISKDQPGTNTIFEREENGTKSKSSSQLNLEHEIIEKIEYVGNQEDDEGHIEDEGAQEHDEDVNSTENPKESAPERIEGNLDFTDEGVAETNIKRLDKSFKRKTMMILPFDDDNDET